MPPTVSPTEPFTAVTVPLAGARRVVASSVFWAAVTVACACVTAASSWAIVVADGVSLAAIVAFVCVRLASAVLTAASCCATACSSAVIVFESSTQELAAVVTTWAMPVLVPEPFEATRRKTYAVPAFRPVTEAVTCSAVDPEPPSIFAVWEP